MTAFGPPERVYVENDWYDGGPRSGIADVNGQPHCFTCLFDKAEDEYAATLLVWPVDGSILALEIEQWHIFAAWNARYESGEATTASHPAHGGVDARWDDLEARLKHSREAVPPDARRAQAQMAPTGRESRYDLTGPDYMIRWWLL